METNNARECLHYIDEDMRDDPKEYFQLMNSLLKEMTWDSLCDVGCATGDFLHYIRSQHGKEKELTGIDSFDRLRDIAASRLPDCRFYKGNIWTAEGLPEERYDVVCMSGVLNIVDDFRRPIENLAAMLNEGGTIMIFAQFDPHDCHTRVDYKIKGHEETMEIYSLSEVSQWLGQQGFRHTFLPFKMKAAIKERKDDPSRSYTVALADGTNGMISGIGLWIEQYLLVIDR